MCYYVMLQTHHTVDVLLWMWFYLHRSLVIFDIGYFEQFKIWLHKGYNDGNLDAAPESEPCLFLVKLLVVHETKKARLPEYKNTQTFQIANQLTSC